MRLTRFTEGSLRREASATLVAAPLQDLPPGTRLHARAEAVLALAPADVWLVGALHLEREGAKRARSIAVDLSTDFSTGELQAGKPDPGVSPIVLHRCGGKFVPWKHLQRAHICSETAGW